MIGVDPSFSAPEDVENDPARRGMLGSDAPSLLSGDGVQERGDRGRITRASQFGDGSPASDGNRAEGRSPSIKNGVARATVWHRRSTSSGRRARRSQAGETLFGASAEDLAFGHSRSSAI